MLFGIINSYIEIESRLPNLLPSCACTMLVILTQNLRLHKYDGVNINKTIVVNIWNITIYWPNKSNGIGMNVNHMVMWSLQRQ
jgi:hypothetical protein